MTRSSPSIRSRLHALSGTEWAFLAAGLTAAGLAVGFAMKVLETGRGIGGGVLFGLFGVVCYYVVREAVRPEVSDECRECGRVLIVDSARDSDDTAVTVQQAGSPTRRKVGPLSVITRRDRDRGVYCSAVCVRRELGSLEDRVERGPEPIAGRLEDGEREVPV